ncbi:MAG: T9SS type A sorting domain-containing protein [Chitinophagaceae bacterium]|nr:T9SS type A sorting domain-containing protein [Chitinophagaceae bacterium]
MTKKISLFVTALMFITLISKAQIPNPSFENWETMTGYSNPTGWGTMNNLTSLASVYTAEKATPGTAGSSYLKLTSKTTPAGVANGIAVSGKLDSITQQPISGFPYNNRPTKLTGKWQHMIFGSSQGSISIQFTKWNTSMNMRDIIGTGSVTLSGMAMSWASFNIPITFSTADYPDSCIIVMKASGTTPTNNDYLWVDDLAFDAAPLAIHDVAIENISIYPNPSSNNWSINGISKSNEVLSFDVINSVGEIVYHTSSSNKQVQLVIDNKNLAIGNYVLKITGNKVKQSIKLSKTAQ